MHVLSIDLGTSNTVAVLSTAGRPPRVVEVDGAATMPSAVFADGAETLLVGREAERRARLDPARFEPNPKRRVDEGSLLLGDAVVPVTEALAAVLRRVAEEAVRQLGGERPDEVRLTHPAQWGAVRRAVLLGAAHRVPALGANLLALPEPVAAAAHFASFPGRSLPPGGTLAVYDLGAGTFDCAVVGATGRGFVVLAEDGLSDLGGLDVDQALAEHLGRQVSTADPARWQRLLRPESTADRRAQRALREDVRAAKEALSRHPQADVPMPEPFPDALVTRGELEALIRPNLLRSVEVLAATVRAAGLEPRTLAGVYLVGGSSRIPLVATLIAERFGVVPTSLDQPETAVALGAHHVPREGVAMRTDEVAPQTHRHTRPFPPPAAPHTALQPAHADPGAHTGPQPSRASAHHGPQPVSGQHGPQLPAHGRPPHHGPQNPAAHPQPP
ncbi:MAG TPA: Hsp70 family protein, partial [Pseudonocardiaceae bacterium]